MLAAFQGSTQYRPTADRAPMKWIIRHAAWLILWCRGGDAQSPFRAMGRQYTETLLGFGVSVLADLLEVGQELGNPAPTLADRWKPAVWLRRSDITPEHLVTANDGTVQARCVRWFVEAPQKPRSTTSGSYTSPSLHAQKWRSAEMLMAKPPS